MSWAWSRAQPFDGNLRSVAVEVDLVLTRAEPEICGKHLARDPPKVGLQLGAGRLRSIHSDLTRSLMSNASVLRRSLTARISSRALPLASSS